MSPCQSDIVRLLIENNNNNNLVLQSEPAAFAQWMDRDRNISDRIKAKSVDSSCGNEESRAGGWRERERERERETDGLIHFYYDVSPVPGWPLLPTGLSKIINPLNLPEPSSRRLRHLLGPDPPLAPGYEGREE